MSTTITFLGAAQNVTGSSYLVNHNGRKILVDCGLYQERDFQHRNWEPFPEPASNIDAVLLTHAHLDHCGLIPKLVKEGFQGSIHCTPATAEIATTVMLDSARIQEEDIKYKMKRHKKEGRTSPFPYEPMYSYEEAERAASMMKVVPYDKPINITKGIRAQFSEAGHIFGSTFIKVLLDNGGEEEDRSVVFSGDVGRWDLPIQRDPVQPTQADYILVESTYGNRIHGKAASIPDELERVINTTIDRGGKILIPAFAVERTQELLYHLGILRLQNRIPKIPTFVDSPMAIRVTKVFRKHTDLFDEELMEWREKGLRTHNFPKLSLSVSVQESKAINDVEGPCIIIAGSGMCTGGRIKHHLKKYIGDEKSTLLFVGYQAVGTLGRIILDGAPEIRIHGITRQVKAEVIRISGFSAHADRDELLRWLSKINPAPRKVFITHGEVESAKDFSAFLTESTGWPTLVPEYKQTVELE